MDDQRTDREGGQWQLLTPANRRSHVLPFCILLWVCCIVMLWAQPNFWTLKGIIAISLVVAVLIWDKFRIQPKDF
jgi:hypothetical protein